ncbi:MAG TPA: exodeoxyribonuclease VII large subunit, partial [Candidatus Marinimicrobia bacterium]|nr:exodeoxyribonuclease VII large subunit [Candidatus Neomarinimicrobiota bacterium]
LLRQRIQRIDELEGRIVKAINSRILSAQVELDNIHKTLEVLNPRAIMERGFAIVYHWPDKKIIKSISEIAVGEQVSVELKDGEFQAKTEIIQSHKN